MNQTASRAVAIALVILILAPATAVAQKDQFFDALLPMYRALTGTYGDEGPQVTASLDALSTALTRWDAASRDAEATVRAQLSGATPQAAMQGHTLLASMYMERGRFADALREFDEDIRLDPGRAAFHRFKGLGAQALNRRPEAADAFRAAWLADPADPQNAYRLLVYKSTRTTAAQRTAARQSLAPLERALVRGEQAKADSPFISLRAINDDAGGAMAFAPAAYAQAIGQILNGQLETGMTSLRAAAAADSLVTDPALRLGPATRGIAALRQGQAGQAVELLRTALMFAPASSELHRVTATAEITNGDVTEGLQHLRDAVRLDPKNERASLALARMLDDRGDWVGAAAVLSDTVRSLPDAGELRWQLSVISGKRQRTDSSDLELIATVDRVVMLVGTGELYSRVARLAQAHLDYERAIALLEARVVLTPNNARAHKDLGRAYVDQGREDEGYAELTVALWLDPVDADTLATIGRLHLAAGRYPAALDALGRAVMLEPGNAQSIHALGEALVRAGNTGEGQQRLEEAQRLQERAVEAQRRSRTAGMLSLQAELQMTERNYPAAIDAWRQATELEGRNSATYLRLAEALVAAQRLDEAVLALQSAIALNSPPDAHRRLADVYTTLGRGDDAARERTIYTTQSLQQLQERAGIR